MSTLTALPAERTTFSRDRARIAASAFKRIPQHIAMIFVEEADEEGIVNMTIGALIQRTGFGEGCLQQAVRELCEREVNVWIIEETTGAKRKERKTTNDTNAGPLLLRHASKRTRFKWNEKRVAELVDQVLAERARATRSDDDGGFDPEGGGTRTPRIRIHEGDERLSCTIDDRQVWCDAYKRARGESKRYKLRDGGASAAPVSEPTKPEHWEKLVSFGRETALAVLQAVTIETVTEVAYVSCREFFASSGRDGKLVSARHRMSFLPHEFGEASDGGPTLEDRVRLALRRRIDAPPATSSSSPSTPAPATTDAMPLAAIIDTARRAAGAR